jgi:spore maturation protein CgeD
MESTPFFEVLLASHDRPRLCARAIASVMAQTHRDFHLWVLDDSSPEGYGQVRKFVHENFYDDKRLRLVHLDVPKGVVPYSWMMNQVYKEAAPGSWVSYLTDDAYYPLDRFEIFADAIRRIPDASVIYGDQVRVNCGSFRFPQEAKSNVHRLIARQVDPQELEAHNWIDHNGLVHRADLLLGDPKPWTEDLRWVKCGDWKCWQKLLSKAPFHFVNRVVAVDEWWPNGLSEIPENKVAGVFGAA